MTSGLSVLEVEIPTGFIVMNDTLRDYVRSRLVGNLRRAEFYERKVVFYFEYVSFLSKLINSAKAVNGYVSVLSKLINRAKAVNGYVISMSKFIK